MSHWKFRSLLIWREFKKKKNYFLFIYLFIFFFLAEKMDTTLQNMGNTLHDSVTDIRGRALCAFANLLDLEVTFFSSPPSHFHDL